MGRAIVFAAVLISAVLAWLGTYTVRVREYVQLCGDLAHEIENNDLCGHLYPLRGGTQADSRSHSPYVKAYETRRPPNSFGGKGFSREGKAGSASEPQEPT